MVAETNLGVGEYFGKAVRRRQAPCFLLTENQFLPDVRIPRHRHQLAHLTCIISGRFVEQYDDRTLECPTGTILLVPAARPHMDVIGPSGVHTLSVELSLRLHKQIKETSLVLDEPVILDSKPVSRLIDKIYSEFRSQDTGSLFMLSALAYEIIALAERSQVQQNGPAWLPAAMNSIHKGLSHGISLNRVAIEVGIHEAHLARTFRRIHGCSVGDYIRFLKLEQAKSMLGNTAQSISEIAVGAGFYDQAHFTREFRKSFGTTPSNYRKISK